MMQCLVQREIMYEKLFIYRKGRQEAPQFTTFLKMQCFEVCLKKNAFGRKICLLYSFLIEYLKGILCFLLNKEKL